MTSIDINDCVDDELYDNYVDTNGKKPTFYPGEIAWLIPAKEFVIITKQVLHYDCSETFFGNCWFLFIDGDTKKYECNGWQLTKLHEGE